MLVIKEKLNGTVIASGVEDQTVTIFEGHWYFSPEVVNMTHLRVTERTYTCPYKGVCYWVDLVSPEITTKNIGWVYRHPLPDYQFIKDQFGFYARDTNGTTAAIVENTVEETLPPALQDTAANP